MHTTQNGANKNENYRMKIETSHDFAIDVIDVIPYAVVLNGCNLVKTAGFIHPFASFERINFKAD